MAVNVVLKAIWDDKGIKEAKKAFGNFGKNIDKAFKAVAVGVGLATAAFAKFGTDAIKQASNLAESTNAVNVAFGDSARAVLAIGESSAESLGVARSEFNQAAVRFSAFAERVVGQGGDVAGFIQDITTRAADFASVFNIDVAEALQVFQSGLSGEAEPLKRFGINLLDTEVKAFALRTEMIKQGETLTEVQKVQARYGLLMESTAKTAGDFANTSSGLANQQRILTARFTDLQAEIGTALLPAVTELVGQFADRLIPVFEEFGDFLASPQGKKIIEDTAKAIGDLFEFIADNINTIVDFALKIAAAITALKLLKTALEFATIAQSAFNLIVKANPYILAATAIISLIGALKVYTDWLVASGIVKEKDTKSAEALTEEIRRLEEAHEDGLIPTDKFTVKLEQLESELRAVQGAAMDVDLSALRTQFGDTRVDALRLVSAQRQLYYAMKGVTPPPLPGQDDDAGGGGGGGGGGGQSDREKAFERVQKIIKDAQKKIRDANERYTKAIQAAQKTYDKTIADATATYSEAVTQAEIQRDKSLAEALKAHNQNIATIQRDFANRQADIIQQSIDRLRDAYASAVRTNVADLFGTDAVGKSIDKLIANLRERLTASRTLVSNAASLASSGFSQTFIEQVVGAGLETGNELAKAILTATPETQRELQSLFGALETESESGMDTLAKTIFDKTGLATTELKRLFEQTKTDLAESLKQAQIDYTASQDAILISFNEALAQAQKARDEAFGNATTALNEALSSARDQYLETLEDIREAFNEQIAAMEGQLGGLGNTVKQLLAMMAQLAAGGAPKISTLPSFPTGGTTPVIQTLPLTPQKPTVVNNNTFIVKQDVTQSPSMTGAAISKAINKYVGGGGGLNRGIAAV